MPTLLQWSETTGCGATIKLDGGDVVYVSVAGSRVTVRQWNLSSPMNVLISRFFGPKLYDEKTAARNARTAAALSVMHPDHEPALPQFENAVLAVFARAIWHCGSAGEARAMLAEAAAREPDQT